MDIPGYKSIVINRKITKKGGLGFCVSCNLAAVRRDDLSTNVERVLESLFKKLTTSSKEKIIIDEIYRSPSGSTKQFMEILYNVLGEVLSEKSQIILMGDLNVDMMHTSSSQACDVLVLVVSNQVNSLYKYP